MFYRGFSQHYGSGNRNIFCVSRKAYTDIFDRIGYRRYRKICVTCYFYQFYFCRAYDCYNFLSTGNRTYKDKSFYYCIAPDISSCPFGMDVSFYRFKCGVVDISDYRVYCQHDRNIDNMGYPEIVFPLSAKNIIIRLEHC